MQYKLSYNVAEDKERTEKVANSEIELAANILDMERDVGFLCHGVTIEQGDFNENPFEDNKKALLNIKRWAEILLSAPHLNLK